MCLIDVHLFPCVYIYVHLFSCLYVRYVCFCAYVLITVVLLNGYLIDVHLFSCIYVHLFWCLYMRFACVWACDVRRRCMFVIKVVLLNGCFILGAFVFVYMCAFAFVSVCALCVCVFMKWDVGNCFLLKLCCWMGIVWCAFVFVCVCVYLRVLFCYFELCHCVDMWFMSFVSCLHVSSECLFYVVNICSFIWV